MSRVIKFRAWDKEAEEYYHGYNLTEYTKKDIYFERNFYNLELEQFTGLIDKNGVEIYEGDILFEMMEDDDGCFEAHWAVVFDQQYAIYDICSHGESVGLYTEDIRWNELEVVGNIHQTPVKAV